MNDLMVKAILIKVEQSIPLLEEVSYGANAANVLDKLRWVKNALEQKVSFEEVSRVVEENE